MPRLSSTANDTWPGSEGGITVEVDATPRLSVVIVASGGFETIARTCAHLVRQTVCNTLEIVIVAPPGFANAFAAAPLTGFQRVRIIEHPPGATTAQANALGIQSATAEVVAMAEDHSFPESEWAEALIAAHQSACAAVGPAVENANPGGLVSWASFLRRLVPGQKPVYRGRSRISQGTTARTSASC